MVKRICSFLTLIVLMLTQCFTSMNYVLAENNSEPDFQIEEKMDQEDEVEEIIEKEVEEKVQIEEETTEETKEVKETIETEDMETAEDISIDNQENEEEEEDEIIEGVPSDNPNDNNGEGDENTGTTRTDTEQNTGTTQTDTEQNTGTIQTDTEQNTGTIPTDVEQNTGTIPTDVEQNTETTIQTGENMENYEVETRDNEEGMVDTITEEIQEIITKIRYFFKRDGDSRYIKYGRDSNNIGTITLKDPKTSTSITIMDKNLGAESVGVGRSSYGYYFQWGNNSGVKTVNGSNKTTEKAIYKDSYYNRGYDGKGMFIVGGRDYWENGDHYNSLWGNESKESSRYGSCPVGYHIPTVKEWNQLLSIWGKIHTQDTSTGEMVLRYSANYATKNIHTFKGAATQCSQGDTECVDEDKLSVIIDTLSLELKLPLAGSYDENGNFHNGLGVYWTSISKDGNKAGVFDMNAYIGNGEDDTLMYKAQGHNIRCFQNVELYEEYIQPENEIEEIDVQDSSLVSISFSGNQNNGNNNSESQTGSLEDFVFLPQNNDGEGDVQDSSQENVELQEGSEDKCPEHYHKNGDICEIDTYVITRKNEDGSVRETTTVEYGQVPTHEDVYQPADAHYTYKFVGWEPEISEVIGDAEYRAKYKYTVNRYTVTWKDEDGTTLKTQEVEYGTTPIYSESTPIKQSTEEFEYKFAGWEPVIEEIKGDTVYTAKYIETPIIQNEESKDGEAETNSIEQDSENDKQDIQEIISELQNNENIQSGTHGNENEGSYDGGISTNEDISTNTLEGENSVQEGKKSEDNQGLFGGLWETLKSFFLADEGGYLRGSETIDNIVVNVEAEKGIFPNGTEVIIKGVSQDRLESIQTSLIKDESNNITENAQILAFDISFVYSGEEIQPTKEVSVKFNYKDNLDFQGVSTSQVSVYHIDDETDEGQKVEVANNDGNEIEILTSDFSVYVLALTENNNITLTLDPGSGTIITGDNIVVDENGIGTITSVNGNVTLPNATRENHVFVGWYTSQTPSLQSFVGNGGDEYHINSNITLYASWCNNGYTINTEKTSCILEGDLKTILDQNPNFMWGEIEIGRPSGLTDNDGPISITIMDRNLGSLIAGTDSNAYGYYYQFGNNRGFSGGTIETIDKANALVDLSQYTVKVNPYYNGKFVFGNKSVQGSSAQDWAIVPNDNIWGGNGTEDLRQGPCPVGWHVPTTGEWQNVVNYWTVSGGMTKGVLNSSNITSFRNDLKLTFAGERGRKDSKLSNVGTIGNYRTTQVSPVINKNSGGRSYIFRINANGGGVVGDSNYNRANGQAIRCFKNEDTIVREYTITYNDGVDDREIFEDQIFSGLLEGDDFPQFIGSIPSRTGDDGVYHEFVGWFLEGTEIAFDVSGAKVNGNTSLYAIWKGCPIGEEENALGFCVPTAEEQRNRQIVQDLELYFLASDQNKVHYTIMDRNMGATAVFDKYYAGPNLESLGYLYQWGNNYGFPAQGDLVQQGIFISTSQVPKSIWSEGVPSNYASGTYYLSATDHVSWMENPSIIDGIWGGTGDTRNTNGSNTTLEARQGPCPVGYHVPSTLEWTTIFMDWSGSNIGVSHVKVNNRIDAIYKFSEDLLLPPAGRRGVSGVLDYTTALSYWSSSPATSDAVRADGLYAKPEDKIEIPNADGRARARSVRCVKNAVNTSATSISTDDIHLDGGGNAVISIDNGVISTLGTPTRADSTFNGWYTTSDFSGNPLSTGDTVSAGSSLYAKFTCNESGYVWNGTICEDGVRLIFDSMGGTDVPSQLIKSGTTGVRPENPTKTGYVFSGWFLTGANEEFNFIGTIITESTTLYAHWNTGQYEVSIVSNNEDYGTVNSELVTTDYLTPISTNGNELIIGSTTVIATPTETDLQYMYTFSGWNNTCGNELIGNCTITANFNREVNRYDVIFDSDGGDYTPPTQSIEYGFTVIKPTPDPTKIGYEFDGWTLSGNDFNFSTPITGITNLVAKWNLVEYTITYNLDGGTNNDNNPEIYSVESGTITLQQPTKTGYTFLGWTGSNGDNPQTNVEIPTGSYGDKEYNAVWKANTTQYTVYHYVKKVGENIYALSKTDILTGTTDEILVFSSLAKESEFICAHYSSGSLVGTENGPGEIATETTIKGDGSTEVYLYYTRNSHTLHLSGDKGVDYLEINGERTTEAVRECGSEVLVNAVPKPGYHFIRWDREERTGGAEDDELWGEQQ